MAYWAPPTAWAPAMMIPSCMTVSQVDHPVPAAPIRSASVTRTRSKSTRYWVSEAMLICWVSRTPSADRSTTNRSTSPAASPVRTRTTRAVAAWAKATWRLVPVMT